MALIGTMPNIVANRISSQHDFRAPGFVISAEELSGFEAPRVGIESLQNGEADAAIVGAVDLCREPVQEAAARSILPKEFETPGDAAVGRIPPGLLNQALLDGATHRIPHDHLEVWSDEIPPGQFAYPVRLPSMTIHGATPVHGEVRCEARFDGFAGDRRFPAFRIQLLTGDRVWIEFQLVEALFPEGPLGSAPALQRGAFLRDRTPVRGLGLSRFENGATCLTLDEFSGSDWLPGTVASVYALSTDRPVEETTVKDHIAWVTASHPSRVRYSPEQHAAICSAWPLNRFPIEIQRSSNGALQVRDSFAVLVMGKNVSGIAETLRAYGAAAVLTADSADLENPIADKYAQVIFDVAKQRNVTMLVGAASTFSKDILPSAAALLDADMLSDVIDVQPAAGDYVFKRVMFAGNVIATVKLDGAATGGCGHYAEFAPNRADGQGGRSGPVFRGGHLRRRRDVRSRDNEPHPGR